MFFMRRTSCLFLLHLLRFILQRLHNLFQLILNSRHADFLLFLVFLTFLTMFRSSFLSNFPNFTKIIQLLSNFTIHVFHSTDLTISIILLKRNWRKMIEGCFYFLLLIFWRQSVVGPWTWGFDVCRGFESLLISCDWVTVASFWRLIIWTRPYVLFVILFESILTQCKRLFLLLYLLNFLLFLFFLYQWFILALSYIKSLLLSQKAL